MKGNNTLKLNESTMIMAVQMYLDSMMKEPGTIVVKSVKSASTGYATLFEIETSEKEDG